VTQNPYETPHASIELAATPIIPAVYAGFWRRFGAMWIDALVFLPIMGLTYYLSEQHRLFHVYWLVPGVVIGLLFHVYLVFKYGGTPGKLALNIRIAMADGSPITLRAAAIRHSVLFILSFLSSVGIALATLKLTDGQHASLGYLERSLTLVSLAPDWYDIVRISMQIWIWSEFLTMLFNKRRRAIHDFMAGTVVVRTI
jgi:uncharacterized RDD family membrane protein YckC